MIHSSIELAAAPWPFPARPKGGDLARLAGRLCQITEFQAWCGANDAEEAAAWVRAQCGVQSRAEIDHSAAARGNFHQLVRIPFVERDAQ